MCLRLATIGKVPSSYPKLASPLVLHSHPPHSSRIWLRSLEVPPNCSSSIRSIHHLQKILRTSLPPTGILPTQLPRNLSTSFHSQAETTVDTLLHSLPTEICLLNSAPLLTLLSPRLLIITLLLNSDDVLNC